LRHAAPVARFALAFAVGVGWGLLGAPIWTAPLLAILCLAAPKEAWSRPADRHVLVGVACLGFLTTLGEGVEPRCLIARPGSRVELQGRFVVTPRDGSAPFERADGCGSVTIVLPRSSGGVSMVNASRAGYPLLVSGVWREGRRRPWLEMRSVESIVSSGARGSGAHDAGAGAGGRSGGLGELRWWSVRWRDALVDRIRRLYGPNASLVTALTLARREGMSPSLREVFATTGLAHLLAISGFHVGVIAGVALILLRAVGVGRRSAALGAAGLAWAYVALIGFPDAACRAALILALVAVSRGRGRPSSRWGALGAAALMLLALDPGRLASPGFQLSFAGAAGLVAWSRVFGSSIDRITRGYMPRALTSGMAAGVAATLATLPIVAWHFERVSVVGIPMTLLATPLVALALPGAIASVMVDFLAPGAASFLAGGVSVILDVLLAVAEGVANWPGVSVWTNRSGVIAALIGVGTAVRAARRPGVAASGRRGLMAIYVVTASIAWPLVLEVEQRGSLEIVMIDVGQGDAIAIRTPGGRWLLVDAGPPQGGLRATDGPREPRPDPRAHPVVRALRRRGVERLQALVLTHPDLDHIGGAPAVLSSLEVERVIDPAFPSPKSAYSEVLAVAAGHGVPWSAARAGQVFDVDGVTFRVLYPTATVPNPETRMSMWSGVSWRTSATSTCSRSATTAAPHPRIPRSSP